MNIGKAAMKRAASGEVFFQVFCYIVFGLFALVCILPFYYILIVTISDNSLISRGILLLYPRGVHLSNIIGVFQQSWFWPSALVSLGRTVIGTLLTVFASAWLGYAFTKKELWKRGFWYKLIVMTLYFNAGIIPVYMNFRNLGLTDSFMVYVIGFVGAYYIILCKTYIESLPESLEESARMDGAKYLSIFFHIIFPLSMPIVATVSVFIAVAQWNSYMDTLLYIRNPRLFTLQYMLYKFLSDNTPFKFMTAPRSFKMTLAMIVSIPSLTVYPLFQKYFEKGIMIGAIKG